MSGGVLPTLEILPDSESLARAAALRVVRFAQEALAERGRFTLALAGGSTPRHVYARLARDELASQIDWTRAHLFWGDERCVPPDHPESNYRMARETLLDHVPLSPGNIHRIHGEDNPTEAAHAYAQELESIFGGDARKGGRPPIGFDLVLLGMGDDGHTASLFPRLDAVKEERRWVTAEYVEAAGMWRVTLTPVFINAARSVMFMVSGKEKSARVKEVLEGPWRPVELPAQAIRPASGQLIWMLDQAAASLSDRAVD
ncbi:MAG TPA: 6-phosphogluconolactonase [Pyrinomonadaceae bacterium]|jgi:6-phosphogluconolactonase